MSVEYGQFWVNNLTIKEETMAQKDTKETTEVAKVERNLPVLPNLEELQDIFNDNFEGIQPSFEVIKIPTGGGIAWTIPGEGEEPDSAKELVGAILDHYGCRAYWPTEYGGGNLPPECSSLDAKTGSLARTTINDLPAYGDCATCQFSQWGTGKEGSGQACKKMHRIFILLSPAEGQEGGSIFPYLVSLPPTSAEGKYDGSFSTYVVKLTGHMKKLHGVKTAIKLITDKSKGGKIYSKAQFFARGDLKNDDKKTAQFLRDKLRTAMRQKPFETEEYNTGEESNDNEASAGKEPWDEVVI